MSTIIPVPLLSLLTAQQLEQLVCGLPEVSVEMLKKLVRYRDITDSHQLIGWFWQSLEEFTNEERVLFLRFVSGRSRLPSNPADITQKFQIIKVDRVRSPLTNESKQIHINCTNKRYFPLCWSFPARERPPYCSDLLFPASSAPVHKPGHPRRAFALLHPQLSFHRHGQLHADPQHWASRRLRHWGLKQKTAVNRLMNVTSLMPCALCTEHRFLFAKPVWVVYCLYFDDLKICVVLIFPPCKVL